MKCQIAAGCELAPLKRKGLRRQNPAFALIDPWIALAKNHLRSNARFCKAFRQLYTLEGVPSGLTGHFALGEGKRIISPKSPGMGGASLPAGVHDAGAIERGRFGRDASWTAPAERSGNGACARATRSRTNQNPRAFKSGVALRFPPQSKTLAQSRGVCMGAMRRGVHPALWGFSRGRCVWLMYERGARAKAAEGRRSPRRSALARTCGIRASVFSDSDFATSDFGFRFPAAYPRVYFAVTAVSVTGPSRPQSVSGQLEASKGW
jgi:hypothetical protein